MFIFGFLNPMCLIHACDVGSCYPLLRIRLFSNCGLNKKYLMKRGFWWRYPERVCLLGSGVGPGTGTSTPASASRMF